MARGRSEPWGLRLTQALMTSLAWACCGCGLTDTSSAPAGADAGPSVGGGASEAGTTSRASGGASNGANAGAAGGTQAVPDCDTLVAEKRLVRLTLHQIVNSVGAWFGPELALELRSSFEVDPRERAELPLLGPREGPVVLDSIWAKTDGIAQSVAQHVEANFAELTGCDDPSESCATEFLKDFARQAFRRPLSADEEARVLRVFSEVRDTDASIEESLGYGVYATLSAPQFLYRTEFGDDVSATEALTPRERASQLAYFLTDAPPDRELAEAVEQGELNLDDWREQARRLLATPLAQENLAQALDARLGLRLLDSLVIDPAVAPEYTAELRAAMTHEAEWLTRRLWQGPPLESLLTGRESVVNATLADLYGVDFPPRNAALDDSGFARITLPEERSGVLTSAAFLTLRSRPDSVSVVGRGMQVLDAFSCEQLYQPEQQLPEPEGIPGASEREKAEQRMQTPACAECHQIVDPPGLALFGFDVIGKSRANDPEGRPIDTHVTLVDGTPIAGAAELASYLAEDDRFCSCLASYWLSYALAEVSEPVSVDECATQTLVAAFDESSRSLSDLLVEVAISPTSYMRRGATAP